MIKTLAMKTSTLKLAFLSVSMISLSGCGLASLPGGYTPIEKQTVSDLSRGNYTPRTAEERKAIQTQELFAQAAFWSREYDLNPADLEAAINLSSTLRRLGNPSKAIEVATQTRALYSNDVDLMTELAAAQIANNQPQKAVKIIDEALAQRPQIARLWSMKGASMDQMEMFTQAREYYSKAMQIDPNNSGVMANIGLSYALEGDPRTAEVWLRRAASAPNASATVRQNLSLVLGLQGKTDEAKVWASRDLNETAAKANADYMRSLRGSTPQQQSQQPAPSQMHRGPARSHNRSQPQQQRPQIRTYGQRVPQRAPTQIQRPQHATPQTYTPQNKAPQQHALRSPSPQQQTVTKMPEFAGAPRSSPQTAMQSTPAVPMSVLDKIALNNRSKITVAQNQQAQLQARAQQRAAQHYAAQQQAQQQNYRPQHPYTNPIQTTPQYGNYPQYARQQHMVAQGQTDPRHAARTRRR